MIAISVTAWINWMIKGDPARPTALDREKSERAPLHYPGTAQTPGLVVARSCRTMLALRLNRANREWEAWPAGSKKEPHRNRSGSLLHHFGSTCSR